MLCGTLAAAMLLVWLGVPSVSLPLFRALAVLLAAVSFVAVIYTGLLLSGMPSVPLWFGPWLPGLFAISALSCGVALVGMVAVFSGMATVFGRTMRQVVRADMVLLALEAVVVALWLGAAWLEHGGSASSGGNAYRCGRVGIGGLRIERCVLSAVLGRPCARWHCCSFACRGCPRALQCE